jgi:hypothetical protein
MNRRLHRGSITSRAIDLLYIDGGTMTTSQVVADLGEVRYHSVRQALYRAAKRGQLVATDGAYRCPQQ